MLLLKGNFLCLSILLLLFCHAQAQEEIDIVSLKNKITEIRIATKSQSDTLSLTKENSTTPILGNWTGNDNYDVFKPIIPLDAGKKYLVYRNGKNTDSIFLKRKKQVPPSVLAFYPTTDTIPENLLKCYILFSQPMKDLNIYEFLSVQDGDGKLVNDVFLPIQPALWNEDQTVLTLWIDPGRVKRDLIRSKNLGTPLKAGKSYQIKISSKWQAINGEALSFDYRKSYYVSERDEKLPNTRKWQINSQESNTLNSLTIDFPESMDYLTALEGIKIYKDDQVVDGKASLRSFEKKWVFIPDSEWQKGTYVIKLDPRIEDNAGNNLLRLFDNDLNTKSKGINNSLQISFSVQ